MNINIDREEYEEVADIGFTKVYRALEPNGIGRPDCCTYAIPEMPGYPSSNGVPFWYIHLDVEEERHRTFRMMCIKNHGFTPEQEREVIEFVYAHNNLTQ